MIMSISNRVFWKLIVYSSYFKCSRMIKLISSLLSSLYFESFSKNCIIFCSNYCRKQRQSSMIDSWVRLKPPVIPMPCMSIYWQIVERVGDWADMRSNRFWFISISNCIGGIALFLPFGLSFRNSSYGLQSICFFNIFCFINI